MTGTAGGARTAPHVGRRAPRAAGALAAGVLVLAVAACGSTGTTPSAASGGMSMGAPDGTTVGVAGEDSAAVPAKDGAVTSTGLAATDVLERSVIRTGTARVRVVDVQRAALDAAQAARGLGGLVSAEQTIADPQDPSQTTSDLTLRVPNARFDDLLDQVRGLGDVLSQTQQATDVTGQVADIDARVEAQRASVRRIQALLSQANKIGDVVAIESQLAERQSDLESLEAQQKALADQTTLATLSVSIVGPEPVGTPEDDTGFMAGLRAGWKAFTDALQTGLTGLGAVLPFVGFFLVIALPLLAWSRSRGRRTVPAATAPPAEEVREEQPVG
jgi:Domain of unknown function (DUF4349)